MKNLNKLVFTFLALHCLQVNAQNKYPVIVIHGGAGVIERGMLSKVDEAAIIEVLQLALDSGYAVLDHGGSALNAIEKSIIILENSPYFNAGHGAVMNYDGRHELDASIMDGSNLEAGAVAGISTVKNPILAAKAVMLNSPHVLLSGEGAEIFAKSENLELVDNSYFTTENIKKSWSESKSQLKLKGEGKSGPKPEKFGTVGAVAVDREGNIAAGTSTGGMMNKKHGRIGDSPLIGAGTYADNSTCGISCTGHGEYFIRVGVAKEISDQMAFANKSLDEAVQFTLHKKLTGMGALGGLIGLDNSGNVVMEFNTSVMYRGYRNQNESIVRIYAD